MENNSLISKKVICKNNLKLKDIWLQSFFINLSRPYIWIYLGMFIFYFYRSAVPYINEKKYITLSIGLAADIVFWFLSICAIGIILILIHLVTRRLKGVLGDHEL